MIGLAAHIAAMMLALAGPAGGEDADAAVSSGVGAAPMSFAPVPGEDGLTSSYQTRVEGRITIRISPRRRGDSRMLSALPTAPMSREMRGVPIARCLSVGDVVGVQVARGNSLLLYLRDRQIVLASLERACRARDFYSGFYVASQEDGQICVQRDELLSRVGARCKVESWQALVPVEE